MLNSFVILIAGFLTLMGVGNPPSGVAENALLLEDGTNLLLENGTNLLLE